MIVNNNRPKSTSKKNHSLNGRQILFCLGLLKGLPATRAYEDAGYSTRNKGTVESGSSSLIRNPKVIAYLDRFRNAMEEDAALTHLEIRLMRARIVRDATLPVRVRLQAMRDEERVMGWSTPQVIELQGSLIDQIREG